MAQLLYQGHSSFRIITEKGLVFYIDPYKGGGYDVPADVILVTHGHFDHCQVEQVAKKDDCTLISYKEAFSDNEYNSFQINDILVEAVPAYNKFHMKDECVGYMLELEGKKLYFPGDTAITEEMSSYPEKNIDFFFVPMDGIYTMDEAEAKKCCDIVQAKHCIPIHTAPQYGKDEDALYDLEKAQRFEGLNKIIIQPGELFIL